MKKIFVAVLAISMFALSNCNVSVREAKADDSNVACSNYDCVKRKIIHMDGMKYALFYSTSTSSSRPSTMFLVNITKDKLEVQLLNKQLKE
tara:strand:+ start:640 stop:912 length:273 start_codon:yes stop_codon:yes gene_type:complete